MGASALMGGSTGAKAQANAQTQAAQIQSDASLQIAQLQSDAALQAAQIQSDYGLQAAQLSYDGAMHSAGLIAGAQHYAADLSFQAAENSLAEQKRQYDYTTETLKPYVELGEKFLPEIENAATTEGFAQRLSDIMDTDIFSDLQSERFQAADSRLAQAGLNRSGAAAQSASDITADLALGLDSVVYGRQMNNVNIGQAASARQANVGQNYANAVTSINTNTAQTVGNQAIASAQAQGGFITQGANASAQGLWNSGQAQAAGLTNSAYYMGQGQMGAANATANGLIGAANATAAGHQNSFNNNMAIASLGASMFFSDARLKENMQPVGKVNGLTLYEWDWKDGIKDKIGAEMSTGFSAQEVGEVYPECVVDICGVKAVNYPELYDKFDRMRLAA